MTDDMGTPSKNHPAHRGLKDRASDKARVIDFASFKKAGVITSPDSPEIIKHENEAMELGNSWKTQR